MILFFKTVIACAIVAALFVLFELMRQKEL